MTKPDIHLYTAATMNGYKPVIFVEEAGVPYDLTLIDFGKQEQKAPAYLELNPNGKIPTIEDRAEGRAIFESGAILWHLAEKYGQFLPTGAAERSEVMLRLERLLGSELPALPDGAEGRVPESYAQMWDDPWNAEGRNERRDFHLGDEGARTQAAERTGRDGGNHTERQRHAEIGQNDACDDRAERHQGSDGKIDPAGDDHQGCGNSQDAIDRGRLQDRDHVGGLHEVG